MYVVSRLYSKLLLTFVNIICCWLPINLFYVLKCTNVYFCQLMEFIPLVFNINYSI